MSLQRHLQPAARRISGWGVAITALALAIPLARGEFDTVINIDGPVRNSITLESNTQLNLLEGAEWLASIHAGAADVTSINIEVNVLGGEIAGRLFARSGSTINLFEGNLGHHQEAYQGSTLNIAGGTVGRQLMANDGSIINISGGNVERYVNALDGSIVNISGGSVGPYLTAMAGSTINLSGGEVGTFFETRGHVNVTGGSIDQRFRVWDEASLAVSGGRLNGSLSVHGSVSITGGAFGRGFYLTEGGTLDLYGTWFRLDGLPIHGLGGPGSISEYEIPSGSVLTGLLADGTPFAFSSDDSDYLDDGTLILHSVELPDFEPGLVAATPELLGISYLQTLIVEEGMSIGRSFNAGYESSIVMTGGAIGENLELVDASLLQTGGTLGANSDAYFGSSVTIAGGQVLDNFRARSGSFVSISGGEIGDRFQVDSGSALNVSGGALGDRLSIREGGVLSFSGGTIGAFFEASAGSQMTVSGGEFELDGVPIPELAQVGNSLGVRLRANQTLSGTLRDGTPFVFSNQFSDSVYADITLRSVATSPPTPGELVVGDNGPTIHAVGDGQALRVLEGGLVPRGLVAGKGATVVVAGGTVGYNFDAYDAHVTITDGTIGNAFTAFYRSNVDIEGGSIGNGFAALPGSTVTMSGGSISRNFRATESRVFITGGSIGDSALVDGGSHLEMDGGSIGVRSAVSNGAAVSIFAGRLGSFFRVLDGGQLDLAGGSIGENLVAEDGSNVNLFGGEFQLNGQSIELSFGESIELDLGDRDILSGILEDGTSFVFARRDRAPSSAPPRIVAAASVAYGGIATPYVLNGDSFAPGTLVLHKTELPPIDPQLLIPGDEPLYGARNGQTVVVPYGSSLGNGFNAGPGSTMLINGGTVGSNLEVNNGTVSLASGTISSYMDAYNGSIINVSGGRIQHSFDSFNSDVTVAGEGGFAGWIDGNFRAVDSTVTVSGGTISGVLTASENSRVTVLGGWVWNLFLDDSRATSLGGHIGELVANPGSVVEVADDALVSRLLVYDGAFVDMSDGVARTVSIQGGEVQLSGGEIDNLRVDSGALRILGRRFWIGSTEITDSLSINEPWPISDRDIDLTTLVADGSLQTIRLDADSIGIDALITVTLGVDLLGDYNFDGYVDAADYSVWRDMLGMQSADHRLAADGNGDGVVDHRDYDLWREHFGVGYTTRPPRHRGAGVPEPAAWQLVALLLTVGVVSRAKQVAIRNWGPGTAGGR